MVISDTAGNGNFASLIPIPYCANHDLPSPTDTHLQFTALLRRTTVLITIYRLRRILICNSLHTAGNGNFALLIPIPYCANYNLPSPTDWLGEDDVVARVDDVRLLESVSTEEVFKTDAITLSDNTHRFTLFHLVRLRSPRRHLLIFLL